MIRTLAASLICVLAAITHTAAQESVSATLSTHLPPLARLSFSSNSVSFPDADPDLVPLIQSSGGPVTVVAKARADNNGAVTLTVQADDDLRSGMSVLPVSLITWTASGPGFVNGTMSRAAPQLVGSWVGSGVRAGTLTFRFENRWTHSAGVYSVTFIYTLSAP